MPRRYELDDATVDLIDGVLASGEFGTAEDIIRAALEAFVLGADLPDDAVFAGYSVGELKRLSNEGESGPGVSVDDAFDPIIRRLEARIASDAA